jgi:hypothetical protein
MQAVIFFSRRRDACGATPKMDAQARLVKAHDPEKWEPVFGQDHADKVLDAKFIVAAGIFID